MAAPTTVQQALDQLAARTKILEAGGGTVALDAVSAQALSAINVVSNALSASTAARIVADNLLSNAISNEISVRTSAINAVSNAASNALSAGNATGNAASNAISIISQALSVETANRISGVNAVSNAASNALSVGNAASNTASIVLQAVFAETSNRLSAVDAVSNAISIVSNALSNEASNRTSAINAVSNAASVATVGGNAASNAASIVSQALSNEISNRTSADNVLSQQVSIARVDAASAVSVANAAISITNGLGNSLSNYMSVVSNAFSNEISNRTSAINIVSNAASNALSVGNAASNAASIISNALSNEISNRASAVAASNTAINVVSNVASNNLSIANAVSNAASIISNALSNEISNRASAINVVSNAASNALSVATAAGTGGIVQGLALINGYFTATVASNALTIAIKTLAGADPSSGSPVKCQFRESFGSVATSGNLNTLTLTAATSFVISSGSTMGQVALKPFRLWIVAFNDGGTFKLGAISCTANSGNFSTVPLRDYMLATATAEGGAGAADSANVFYTGVVVSTAQALRVLGYLDFAGLAVAGAWSNTPDVIQTFMPGTGLPGTLVQRQTSRDATMATGTTLCPTDATIPQSNEGDQHMSQAITPSAKCNILRITHEGHWHNGTANSLCVALFQDSTANALASLIMANFSIIIPARLLHMMLANTNISTTFKIRGGSDSAGTHTFNGFAGVQYQGGTVASYLTIEELMA